MYTHRQKVKHFSPSPPHPSWLSPFFDLIFITLILLINQRVLAKHGHWINSLSLNTDYALRTGSCDHTGVVITDPEKSQARALERYNAVKGNSCEVLVSGNSNDCAKRER
jgi:hypothetical protein